MIQRVIPSEIRQGYSRLKSGWTTEREGRLVVTGATGEWEKWIGERLLMDTEFLFGVIENILSLIVVMGYTKYDKPLNCTH